MIILSVNDAYVLDSQFHNYEPNEYGKPTIFFAINAHVIYVGYLIFQESISRKHCLYQMYRSITKLDQMLYHHQILKLTFPGSWLFKNCGRAWSAVKKVSYNFIVFFSQLHGYDWKGTTIILFSSFLKLRVPLWLHYFFQITLIST